MEESTVAYRLKFFIENEGLTISQFADQCGIPRPSLSQLLSGRNKKLSDIVVRQIHTRFPDLSVVWLMFGEGEMMSPKPINPALMSEAAKFMDDDTEANEDSNLINLNSDNGVSNTSINQAYNSTFLNTRKSNQIDKIKSNPRKVVSITVFYDDNSYETFLPGRK